MTGPDYNLQRVAAQVHATVTWSDGTTEVIEGTQLRLQISVHLGRQVIPLEAPFADPLVIAGVQPDRLFVDATRYDDTSTLTVQAQPENGTS